MKYMGVIIVLLVVAGVIVAAFRARRSSKEESALTMHPDNFKKPGIEQVEKLQTGEQPGGDTIYINDKPL